MRAGATAALTKAVGAVTALGCGAGWRRGTRVWIADYVAGGVGIGAIRAIRRGLYICSYGRYLCDWRERNCFAHQFFICLYAICIRDLIGELFGAICPWCRNLALTFW